MATTTPNFGWPVPTSTDLVKDGATAIEALGDAIDASLVDLEGGTTGQILAKASNTDMDFTWITNDVGDITAVTAGTGISGGGTSGAVTVTNSMATTMTTKGDLVPATGSGTFARLAAGNNGESLVADSSTATGLRYNTDANANLLANGSFDIWQRGTSFTGNQIYTADRWYVFSSNSYSISQETSVIPEGATNALKITGTGVDNYANMQWAFEQSEVEKLAGKTITFSVYLRANATYNGSTGVQIYSNTTGNTQTGGTWTLVTGASSIHTPSTSTYTRVTVTGVVPTNAKGLRFYLGQQSVLANGSILYVALAKAELGSVATPFVRCGGSLAGELAVCKRYLPSYDNTAGTNNGFVSGYAYGTNSSIFMVPFDVPARVNPTGMLVTGTINAYALNTATAVTPTFDAGGINSAAILASHTITAGQGARLGITSGAKLLFTGCEL